MESFRLVLLCSFLYVAVVQMGIYASNDVPWGSYWKTALPQTPMPKTLQELLHPDNWIGDKSTYSMNIKTLQGSASGEQDHPVLPKTANAVAAPLLPRKVANSVPFAKSKLPQILNHFALKPNSAEAQVIKQTIQDCEAPSVVGEAKCILRRSETKTNRITGWQREIVLKNGERAVVCHKKKYAYTVFYCHEVQPTRTYMVPLVGADGTKAEAVVICHTDTRTWNSKNFALQELKIKPGTEPICHFLASGNLVWVPNK
ncbi:hypothetical protein M0R45_016235 [Rubus argutus]|uniref:BURP domain-containing protein n=1 Tax=Rubus argutus TaxID=59490 RepID=A0AAW1XSS8_RUBAR